MEEYANKILNTLIKYYGKSKYYDWLPTIQFEDDNILLSGEFRNDWRGIVLYTEHLNAIPQNHLNEEIATIINHEYIHYLQSPSWMTRYNKIYDYYDHPYEIEAYNKENEWRQLCA